jgi:hypothetical protein
MPGQATQLTMVVQQQAHTGHVGNIRGDRSTGAEDRLSVCRAASGCPCSIHNEAVLHGSRASEQLTHD